MLTLPPPKSQLAEVLHGLITENEISESEYRLNGFRSRLSNLRAKGIEIRCKWKNFISKHGNPGKFKVHYLWESEKKRAIRIYNEINKTA